VSRLVRTLRIVSTAAIAAASISACASSKGSAAGDGGSTAQQRAEPARPLAAFMPHRVIVLPVQSLRRDTLGLSARTGEARDLLARIDLAIADSVGERGLRGRWAFSDAVVRSARLNPTYATDPHAIAASQLRAAANRPGSNADPLPEPVASQLRVLVGLQDARYALVPLDVRFEGAPPGEGAGRAALTLVLVDARGSQLLRSQTVTTAPFSDLSPLTVGEVAGAIAGRLADLIAAP
jgi:hypothetical protein